MPKREIIIQKYSEAASKGQHQNAPRGVDGYIERVLIPDGKITEMFEGGKIVKVKEDLLLARRVECSYDFNGCPVLRLNTCPAWLPDRRISPKFRELAVLCGKI